MFQNVGHARGVRGVGLERNAKHVVPVVSVDVEVLGSCLQMLQVYGDEPHLRHRKNAVDFITVENSAHRVLTEQFRLVEMRCIPPKS